MILKMTHEKSNAFKRPLKKIKNAKNDANILKTYIFLISLFFAIFGFFENLSKRWVKNWVTTTTMSAENYEGSSI